MFFTWRWRQSLSLTEGKIPESAWVMDSDLTFKSRQLCKWTSAEVRGHDSDHPPRARTHTPAHTLTAVCVFKEIQARAGVSPEVPLIHFLCHSEQIFTHRGESLSPLCGHCLLLWKRNSRLSLKFRSGHIVLHELNVCQFLLWTLTATGRRQRCSVLTNKKLNCLFSNVCLLLCAWLLLLPLSCLLDTTKATSWDCNTVGGGNQP